MDVCGCSNVSHDIVTVSVPTVCISCAESGGRVVGENKALTSKKARFSPYTTSFNKCRICKQVVHQAGSHYCQGLGFQELFAMGMGR